MKALIAILIAIGLGLGVGYAFYQMEASTTTEPFYSDEWSNTQGKGSSFSPSVSVANSDVDFGKMKLHKPYTTTFEVQNKGQVALQLWRGSSVPNDIYLDLQPDLRKSVKPGETFTLTVIATPTKVEDTFSKTIKINSNDPERSVITFDISGKPTGGVFAENSFVTVSREQIAEGAELELKIFSKEDQEFSIKETKISRGQEEGWFKLLEKPIPESELSEVSGVKSGKAIKLSIDKSLPRTVRQIVLSFLTDYEGYAPIKINIYISK